MKGGVAVLGDRGGVGRGETDKNRVSQRLTVTVSHFLYNLKGHWNHQTFCTRGKKNRNNPIDPIDDGKHGQRPFAQGRPQQAVRDS